MNDKKILIMTAVKAEQEAVLSGLKDDNRFEVAVAGVGPVQSAVSTTKLLALSDYRFVVSAGIAGGFIERAEVGSAVLATEIIAADLGAQTADGFSSIEQLGFGFSRVAVDINLVENLAGILKKNGIKVQTGPILTMATVTGSKQKVLELTSRIPAAVAEAMEGFGVAVAAKEFQIPCLEIRTISNPVGPRDRENWKIKEALATLEQVSSLLPEVF